MVQVELITRFLDCLLKFRKLEFSLDLTGGKSLQWLRYLAHPRLQKKKNTQNNINKQKNNNKNLLI